MTVEQNINYDKQLVFITRWPSVLKVLANLSIAGRLQYLKLLSSRYMHAIGAMIELCKSFSNNQHFSS
jgi:hypothetical protein